MKEFAALIGALVILAAASVAEWLLEAWWLMLAIGDIHRNWWAQVPLMGFKAALPVGFCLAAFIAIPVTVSVAQQVRKNK